MKTTIRSIIKKAVRNYFISSGELYQHAILKGYKGTQERLLEEARRMAHCGILEGMARGEVQNTRFRLSSEAGK